MIAAPGDENRPENTAHCPLPTAHCLLPTAYCPLSPGAPPPFMKMPARYSSLFIRVTFLRRHQPWPLSAALVIDSSVHSGIDVDSLDREGQENRAQIGH